MGKTHFRSDVVGHAGTEKVASMAGIKWSSTQGMIFGSAAATTAMETAMTSFLGGTPGAGCAYFSSDGTVGGLWARQGDVAASWTRLIS